MALGSIYDRNEFTGALGGLFDRRKYQAERRDQEVVNALRTAQTVNEALESQKRMKQLVRYEETAPLRALEDEAAKAKALNEMEQMKLDWDQTTRAQAVQRFSELEDDYTPERYVAWREQLPAAVRARVPEDPIEGRAWVAGARESLVMDIPTQQALIKEQAEQAAITARERMKIDAAERRSVRARGTAIDQMYGRRVVLERTLEGMPPDDPMRPVVEQELAFIKNQRRAEIEKAYADAAKAAAPRAAKGSTRIMGSDELDKATMDVTEGWLAGFADPRMAVSMGGDVFMGAEPPGGVESAIRSVVPGMNTAAEEFAEADHMAEAEQRLSSMENYANFFAAVKQSMAVPGGNQVDGMREAERWVPIPAQNRIVRIPTIEINGEPRVPTLSMLKVMADRSGIPLGELIVSLQRHAQEQREAQ
jgi:hypothetical protein